MKRAEGRQLYRSPNGDIWFLARDPETGLAFVKAPGEHPVRRPGDGAAKYDMLPRLMARELCSNRRRHLCQCRRGEAWKADPAADDGRITSQ
jgi:hypothetical protein